MSRQNNTCKQCGEVADALAHTLILPNYTVIPLGGLCIDCVKKLREQLIDHAEKR